MAKTDREAYLKFSDWSEANQRGEESEYYSDGEEILEFRIEDNDGCVIHPSGGFNEDLLQCHGKENALGLLKPAKLSSASLDRVDLCIRYPILVCKQV